MSLSGLLLKGLLYQDQQNKANGLPLEEEGSTLSRSALFLPTTHYYSSRTFGSPTTHDIVTAALAILLENDDDDNDDTPVSDHDNVREVIYHDAKYPRQ
jgi:hypothetical protein